MDGALRWIPALAITLCLVACAGAKPAPVETASVESVRLNVHLLIDAPVRAQAETIGERLERELGVRTFAGRGFPLHVTLFMTEFPRDRLDAVRQRVEALARESSAIGLRTTGLKVTRSGWLFLDCDRTPELSALASAVAEALAPLRAPGLRPPDWIQAYPEKLASFRSYGSPNVGDEYEPHLTLLADGDTNLLDRFAGSAPQTPAEGLAVRIGIAVADEQGQLVEELWNAPLGR